MNNIELIESDNTIADYLAENSFNKTKVNPSLINFSKHTLLTSMLVGASLLSSASKNIGENIEFIQTDNYISLALDYDTFINEEFSEFSNNSLLTKQSVVRDILSFKSLNENWDGYGAIPLEIESALNTINLIDLIGERTFCSITDYYPNPNGTITLEWSNNQNEILSIDVGNHTMSYFVKLLSSNVKFFNKISINTIEAEKLSEFIETI